MSTSFVTLPDGRVRIFSPLVVEYLTVGISSLGDVAVGTYPSVCLQYAAGDLPQALAVARAMDARSRDPVIAFTRVDGQPYVAVLFWLAPVEDALLRVFWPQLPPGLPPPARRELVMTAETELASGTGITSFLALYRQRGNFRLQITSRCVEGEQFALYWFRVLREVRDTLPELP
jgi:hypothetical protein